MIVGIELDRARRDNPSEIWCEASVEGAATLNAVYRGKALKIFANVA